MSCRAMLSLSFCVPLVLAALPPSSAAGTTATPRRLACALAGGSVNDWATYAVCLATECEDATRADFANITDCLALQSVCSEDFNTVDNTFPSNTVFVSDVCPSTCGACQIESTTPAVSSCSLGGSDFASWGTYAACLHAECEDATSAAFANITDCPTLQNLCAVDFNTVDSSFPAGAMNVSSVCPSTCGACDGMSTSEPAQSPSTGCVAGSFDAETINTFTACLVEECADATAEDMLNMLSCPQIVAMSPDCSLDLHSVSPLVPEDLFVWELCPRTCDRCAEPTCTLGGADVSDWVSYAGCLADVCTDAVESDFDNTTDCVTLLATSPNCSLDLSLAVPGFQSGFYVHHACPMSCNRCDTKAPTAAPVSAPTLLPSTTMTPTPFVCPLPGSVGDDAAFMQCLMDECVDAPSSVFEDLTDCNGLLDASPDCSMDLASLGDPRLSAGTHVSSYCPALCGTCPQGDDSKTQGTVGLFVGTATGGHTFTVNNAIGYCEQQSNVDAYLASIAVLYATPGADMQTELRQCSVLDASGNVLRRRLAGESVAMQYEVTITSSDYDAVANTMQDAPRRSNDTSTFAQVFEQELAQTTGSSQGLVVTGASLTSVVIPGTGAPTPAPALDEASGASRVLVLAKAWLSIVVCVMMSSPGRGHF